MNDCPRQNPAYRPAPTISCRTATRLCLPSPSFTEPAYRVTGPSGYPRIPTDFRGRPHRASCPGRPRLDFLSIRSLDSRSARRCAYGIRFRKRRRVLRERLAGGTRMSRQACRGRMPLQAVATKRQSTRVAPRGQRARKRTPYAQHRPSMPWETGKAVDNGESTCARAHREGYACHRLATIPAGRVHPALFQ